MKPVPPTVLAAENRAAEHGFEHSCERGVGEMLAVLAATTPLGGRILELGMGFGVGLAWILAGLGSRTDVEVVSVERDADQSYLRIPEDSLGRLTRGSVSLT